MTTGQRLEPELVPEPLWGISGKRFLPGRSWRELRTAVIDQFDSLCAVCGVFRDSRMVCHEKWHYDDALCSAELSGFELVCPDCDAVRHIGRTSQRGHAETATEHMSKVNSTSVAQAKAEVDRSLEEWRSRSQMSWTVTVDDDLLDAHPELRALVGVRANPGEGRLRARNRGQ